MTRAKNESSFLLGIATAGERLRDMARRATRAHDRDFDVDIGPLRAALGPSELPPISLDRVRRFPGGLGTLSSNRVCADDQQSELAVLDDGVAVSSNCCACSQVARSEYHQLCLCRDAGVLELPYAGTLSAGNSQARTKAKSRNLLNKLLSGAVSKPEEISAKLIQNFGSLGKIITITKDEIESFCPEEADSVAETLKIVRHAVECSLRERLLAEPITHCGPKLVDYLVGTMGDLSRECLVCLYLDRRNCLVEAKIVAEGTMSSVPFNVREILSPALAYSASALILSHNHPNGTAQPSEADIAQTRQLQSAASILDIKLHDHIIVAGSRYCSMQEMGLLQ